MTDVSLKERHLDQTTTRWVVRRERGHELDSAWLSLLYLLLGDHLGEQAQVIPLQSRVTFIENPVEVTVLKVESWDDLLGKVRGVVASRRKKGDRVSVWVGDARKLGAVVDVGRMVSCSLVFDPRHFGCYSNNYDMEI